MTSSAKQICTNKGPSPKIQSDLIISEINSAKLTEYDCIFIPSGGYWDSVSQTQEITNFIKRAYENGLFVSSMCVGTGILGKAGTVVKGSKFACHPNSEQLILDSEGIVERANLIIDGQFITGGTGGGWRGGGHTKAPYYEFSAALIQQILGYSYLNAIALTSTNNSATPNEYILELSTTNLSSPIHRLPGVKNHTIKDIHLVVVDPKDITSEIKIPLDAVSNSSFSIVVDFEEHQKKNIHIEVTTNNTEVEIYRDLKNPANPSIYGCKTGRWIHHF